MKCFKLTKLLLEQGLFVNPIVPPAVPSNKSMIRFSLMATHTKKQIEQAVDLIYQNGLNLEIITSNFSMV